MYLVSRTKDFEKSYKKIRSSGLLKTQAIKNLQNAIETLALGKSLPKKFRDHALQGEFAGYRECHIQGDLLLVYRIDREILVLTLIDIGSHSYLFG